ncbi:MAG TPA: CoA-binding protein [Bacteroidia bacterium]|nr:CoA-binding protein [Bacteroidia bacterium]HRS59887.1 CoA-binding protein [Bacteroidia bacterium]HRU68327.1 CoA-binding protein [Bacteroidia bacterium]
MNANEILKIRKNFAIIGVSQDETKYSYEVFHLMNGHHYAVFPVNPRYSEIAGHKCYPSVELIPEKVEVIMLIMAPHNTDKMLDNLAGFKDAIFWFPPDCFSEQTLEKAEQMGLNYIFDKCPVGLLKGFN